VSHAEILIRKKKRYNTDGQSCCSLVFDQGDEDEDRAMGG
jgi:hypothetical protein